MGDLRDQVRDERTPLEILMGAIPGFRGYQEKEDRRDADKLLRMHLVGLLSGASEQLSRAQTKLSAEVQFKPVTDLNRLARRVVRARDRIEHASYGYAGFFDAIKVEAAALDRLYEFDVALQEHVATVVAAAARLVEVGADQRAEVVSAIAAALDALEQVVDQRQEAAAQLSP